MTETVNEVHFEEELADEALDRTSGAKVCPGLCARDAGARFCGVGASV